MPELAPEARRPPHDRAAPVPQSGLAPALLPPPEPPSADAREAYLPLEERKGVALCLSGGGYRAALFHLGAVRRLNEMGALGKLDTITSVSGGSILAAHLVAAMGPSWPAPGEVFANFDERVARPFKRDVCGKDIRTWPLLTGLLPWNVLRGSRAVAELERQYARRLTRLELSRLPEHPRFVFCATDMSYGVNWTFTREEVGSYMAGYVPAPAGWRVARAVAASSCFPPFFNPQPINLAPSDLQGGMDPSGDERDERVASLRLSDGGLYDNMGLEPVWKSHAVILASEGGSTFDAGPDRGLFWRLNRYVEVMGRQGGAQRRRWLISNFIEGRLRGTYWGIGTDIASYDIGASGYPPDLVKGVIAEMRTDMDRFSEPERSVLENHGYLLTDAAIRRYAPFLAEENSAPPMAPNRDWMDPEAVAWELRDSHKRRVPFGRGWPF